MSRRLGNVLIVLGVVALVAVSLVLGSRTSTGDEEKFVGSDAIAADAIAETGHETWFEPLFSPGSGEVESGLFALQAALGAGVLGYCLGRLHGRRRESTRERVGDPVAIPDPEGSGGPTPDRPRAAGAATGSPTP